jgi:hypothetical protein
MKTQAYLYRWTQISTGMWYEGSRTAKGCHPDDGYICSSKIVKKLILKTPEDWLRNILVIGDPLYIRNLENARLLSIDAARDPQSYNRDNGNGAVGFGSTGKRWVHRGEAECLILEDDRDKFIEYGWDIGRSDKVIEKMSDKLLGKMSGNKNPAFGKFWVNNGIEYKLVSSEEKYKYLLDGWQEGYGQGIAKKISEKTKRYYRERTDEEMKRHCRNLSIATTNYHASMADEERMLRSKKISEVVSNAWNSKTTEEKIAYMDKLNSKRYACDHCGIITTIANITRWHNKKCKFNTKGNNEDHN